ncbi:MAG: hypothetical protein GW906_08825 [Epsilonproteobacteria bacterium]|nr:hypothetical protein [Campylobacterota bacterium]PIP11006.1 MAG: hypothetical protein COX50_02705 [Sulfurimonas sp. CG23_combo_of_CG06-09_8_20_14_all_36_33]PIS25391.1 MAG: hypothetical protein COT46_05910 [Sulfurimonas sp. CG08_land_8_20_14_0_20_36_33]PIU36084.1 MAG: hypothetical protein COT05_00525 [Sulfurimonas sp. CG07_land_8_20_14_0_80_36_56]PIV02383.1 MAG: hypothetical protein COS56_12010 [Sulfurimonas sp. CG03_land_8_20_14_0_80_36_25]PIV35224.1 MAG: hypothetical protein COS32_06880 [S
MTKTQAEKEEFVTQIFSDRTLFEKEVVQVSTEADRVEVMEIIAQSLVRDKLKEEINFLYLDTLTKFKLSSIVGTIFNQFANEWLSFAVEVLGYSKESALKEIQEKQRAAFVHSIATLYFKEYGKYIFETIADTFIELVDAFPHANSDNRLVNEILQSDFVLDNNVLIIQSSQRDCK